MNSFKLFGLKRKLGILDLAENFFSMHGGAMEIKKGEKCMQKTNFLANFKSLNESTS